jgi:hypothetical protein
MCGYVACVPDCRGFVCCVQLPSNSEGSKNLPDDSRLLPKHVGASIYNKGVVQINAYCWSFLLRLIMHGTNFKPLKLFCATFKLKTNFVTSSGNLNFSNNFVPYFSELKFQTVLSYDYTYNNY